MFKQRYSFSHHKYIVEISFGLETQHGTFLHNCLHVFKCIFMPVLLEVLC